MTALLHHCFLMISLALFHLVGPVPVELGVHQGALAPCPAPAHCARADWNVANPDAALADLVPVILAMPRIELVEQGKGYVHATATSALFGFVDDLELYRSEALRDGRKCRWSSWGLVDRQARRRHQLIHRRPELVVLLLHVLGE